MNKKDFITYSFWGGLFLLVMLWCKALPESVAYWPRLISIIGLSLSAIGIIRCGIAWFKERNKVREKIFVLGKVQTKHAAVLLTLMIVWIASMKILGFLVSSAIVVNLIVVYFEAAKTRRKLLLDFGVTSVLVIGMYFLFVALGVRFPLGILG